MKKLHEFLKKQLKIMKYGEEPNKTQNQFYLNHPTKIATYNHPLNKKRSKRGMKVANMSVREYGDFYNLGELRRKLRFMELDRLGLKYLNPLRNELDARLQKYNTRKKS